MDDFLLLNRTSESHSFVLLTREISWSTLEINFMHISAYTWIVLLYKTQCVFLRFLPP